MASEERDVRTVAHFVRRLRRVAQHPLAVDRGDFLDRFANVPLRFDRRSDGKTVVRIELPDEVAFESLATRLRPFITQGDDLHFEKAFAALDRLMGLGDDKFRRNFRHFSQQVLGEWRSASDRSDRTRAYWVMVSTETEKYSDVVLAYSWLYGDSVHGDHEKVETLDLLQRFRAAVGFFSGVAVVAIATMNLIRQMVESGVIDLPEEAFTDAVVVTETEIVHEVEVYRTDVGIDVTDDLNALFQSGQELPEHIRPLDDAVRELRAQREQQRSDEDI